MTFEEKALNEIQKQYDAVKNALGKQIPKKPVDIACLYCPSCYKKLDVLEQKNYCANCGQKIDWSVAHELSRLLKKRERCIIKKGV